MGTPGGGAQTQEREDLPVIDYQDAPRFGRTAGIKAALAHLHESVPAPVVIVETGTTRGDLGGGIEGDGWATLAWGWYCLKYGGVVHTIDNDGQAMANCREISRAFSSVLRHHLGDSVQILRGLEGRIDLLYLDSADDPQVIVAECVAAWRNLHDGSAVLIDDTGIENGRATGKGELAHQWLCGRGWTLAFEHAGCRQIMLRPTSS